MNQTGRFTNGSHMLLLFFQLKYLILFTGKLKYVVTCLILAFKSQTAAKNN